MASRGFRSPVPGGDSNSNHSSAPLLCSPQSDLDNIHIELGDLESRKSVGKKPTRLVEPGWQEGAVVAYGERPSSTSTRGWPQALRWLIQRAITAFSGRRRWPRYVEGASEASSTPRSPWSRRPKSLRCILRLLAGALMLLGFIQLVILLLGVFEAFFPDDLEWVVGGSWPERLGRIEEGQSEWPTDLTADIKPVACHSHNDYWRREALFSALRVGCTSVEADIWLFDDDLYVGHSVSSLTANRTLNNMYIKPLLDILDRQNPITQFHPRIDNPPNGVFDTDPSQTLVLLIDFKTDGEALWPVVESQLEPLRRRNYLTHFNGVSRVEGPITVVATGNAPFDLLTANSRYRDIFFDAPLDQMSSLTATDLSGGPFAPVLSGPLTPSNSSTVDDDDDHHHHHHPTSPTDPVNQGQGHSGHAPTNPLLYNPQNSYYASVAFSKSIGYPWRSRLSQKQISLLRAQIRGAHARGLKVRYWSVPSWPRGVRNYVWRVLVREGVDVLNVDDLQYAVAGDWGPRKGGWGGKWWS